MHEHRYLVIYQCPEHPRGYLFGLTSADRHHKAIEQAAEHLTTLLPGYTLVSVEHIDSKGVCSHIDEVWHT